MPFRNWKEAIANLDDATGLVTPMQQKLGEQAKSPLPDSTPKIIAAVTLRLAFAAELNLPQPHSNTGRYMERIKNLQRQSDPPISPQTEEEAEAWVTYLRLVRRRECLSDLKINEGDIVETKTGDWAAVSSIGQDGRIFFKGGKGFGSWPDLITVVARKDDQSDSANKARHQANDSAARRRGSEWSVAKSQDLNEFTTENFVSEDDMIELESVITHAKDERPIQEFLEKNKHLLTALLGGNERYCLPQKRLGGEFVPDFIIGDVDSRGVRWVLIELETPISGIYLKDGLGFDQKARKGIDQVVSWRNWLSSNIAYARNRKSDDGLGLFDIREKTDAIVLVGRRSKRPHTKDAQRHENHQSNNIQIHTYDWLLERLWGAIRFQGPPAFNPFLLPRYTGKGLCDESSLELHSFF